MKETKKPSKVRAFIKFFVFSNWIVVSFFALAVVCLGTWMYIRAIINPGPGMEVIFIVFGPFIVLASIILLINGVVLLIRAVRRHSLSRASRVALAVAGILLASPALYIGYGTSSYYLAQYNAERIRPGGEIQQLVEDCKLRVIRREYVSWDKPVNQRQSVAKTYLRDSAVSRAGEDAYYHRQRTFDPIYYDELAKLASSNEIQSKCGAVELYDEHRENLPITYAWVAKEEALAALEACKIADVYTSMGPQETELKQANNLKSSSLPVFLILDPIAQGYAGRLYINATDQTSHADILNFAKSKKGHCMYKQPNIDGVE